MLTALDHIGSLDYATIGTNAGVILGFLAAAILGIKQGLKAWSKSDHGADSPTLDSWSRSSAGVSSAADALRESIDELNSVMVQCTNTTGQRISELNKELGELRHQVERLRDVMR